MEIFKENIDHIYNLLSNTSEINYLPTTLILINNKAITVPVSNVNSFMKCFITYENESVYKLDNIYLLANPVAIIANAIMCEKNVEEIISNLLNCYNLIPYGFKIHCSTKNILTYAYIFGASDREMEIIRFALKYKIKGKISMWNRVKKPFIKSVIVPDFLSIKYDEQFTNLDFNDVDIKSIGNLQVDYNNLREELRAIYDLNNQHILKSYIGTIEYLLGIQINQAFITKYLIVDSQLDTNIKRVIYKYYKSKIRLVGGKFNVDTHLSLFTDITNKLTYPEKYFNIISEQIWNSTEKYKYDLLKLGYVTNPIQLNKEFRTIPRLI